MYKKKFGIKNNIKSFKFPGQTILDKLAQIIMDTLSAKARYSWKKIFSLSYMFYFPLLYIFLHMQLIDITQGYPKRVEYIHFYYMQLLDEI